MTNRTLRTVLVLGVLCVLGMVAVQIYWVRLSLDAQERKLDQSMALALQSVADDVAMYYGYKVQPNTVEQVASDFFVVSLNNVVEERVLEHYLLEALKQHHLSLDIQYGIYDCYEEKMKAGAFLKAGSSEPTPMPGTEMAGIEDWKRYVYYFGVRLPARSAYLTGEMAPWVYSSILVLLVVGFFSYTLWVILQQKRLSEVQKDFINTMTHEFMTPITSISLAAEVLERPDTLLQPERHSNYTGLIRQEIKRLRSQVETVLQHARLQRHGANLQPAAIVVDDLGRDIAQHFRPKVEARGGTLTCEVKALGVVIHADPTHLSGVIYNLLDNALKYSLDTPQIHFGIYTEGRRLAIRVTDKGMGIPKNAQKRIFERFYRQPDSSLKNIKGFGLGLNYVFQIVRAHKGTIVVDSEVGQGSTFTVYLPLPKAAPAPAPQLATA